MRKTGIVAALLLMGLSQAAFAENRGETVTFAPYVGGYTFQGNQSIETSPVFGFRLGYNLTDNWALEGVVDYLKADRKGGGDMEMLRYGGDVLYNFMPKSSLVPYLAAGFGGFNIDNSKTRGIVNYGGGVKWFLADNFALRADVRGLNYSMSKIYTNVEYTLGLHIAVGAPKPAPAPVVVAEPVVEAVAPKAAPVVVMPAPVPVPTSNLTAEPATLEKGKTTTLTWSSANTSGCEIQPGVGPVPVSGSKVITPAANTSYTLTCKGEGGKTATSVAGVEVTEPMVKEAAAAKASAVAAGSRLSLKVNFDIGKSIIKKQYYDELKVVGDGLNEQKNLKGVIEGHTDNVGSDKSNLALSQRRANAVRDYIVKNFKVDRKRLAAKGLSLIHSDAADEIS
ncbi:MAG: OmpA family protein, partial [Trichlorobacter sp.]|uniref:OmpA family protein n=1 Tax=Trichlorobacter sp. TaxID=2911007 RepID=UPI002568813E